MMTSKRIRVFLVLGVILLGIVISGCAPEQPTEPSDIEHCAFILDKIHIENCDMATFIESLHAAAHPRIYGEKMEAMFSELFNGVEFTDDSTRMDEVRRNNTNQFPCHINFNCPDGTNPLTILVYIDGTLGLIYGEHDYVSRNNNVINLDLLKKWFK